MIPAQPPDPTPEYAALSPQPGETFHDALARVGDGFLGTFNPEDAQPDTSRPKTALPKELAGLIGLRAQGFDNHEIAEKLKVSKQKLTALIAKARKVYGWNDLNDRIAHIAVPKAVDNLIAHLEHEGSKTAIKKGQHALTRRTLDGTGLFRSHASVKHDSATTTTHVLRVEIVIPPAPADDLLTPGVLATPRHALPVIDVEPV